MIKVSGTGKRCQSGFDPDLTHTGFCGEKRGVFWGGGRVGRASISYRDSFRTVVRILIKKERFIALWTFVLNAIVAKEGDPPDRGPEGVPCGAQGHVTGINSVFRTASPIKLPIFSAASRCILSVIRVYVSSVNPAE